MRKTLRPEKMFVIILCLFFVTLTLPANTLNPSMQRCHVLEPLTVDGKISSQSNSTTTFPYVPSQNFTIEPNRLTHYTNYFGDTGINNLASDMQKPVFDGSEFLPGVNGYFEIHHRRGGVRCFSKPIFVFRMELYYPLAALSIAIKEEDELSWIDQFHVNRSVVKAGIVSYELVNNDSKLALNIDVVSPAAVPAYGMIARINLKNQSSQRRELKFIAVVEPNSFEAKKIPEAIYLSKDYLEIACPQKNPFEGRSKYLHDTNYSLLVGWDENAVVVPDVGLVKDFSIGPSEQKQLYLTSFIDSPGYDKEEIHTRINTFIDRNPNLSQQDRQRMVNEAIETFAGIVSEGDQTFLNVYKSPEQIFDECLQICKKGVYRDTPVLFRLPNKKLESLANLTSNDLFPGLVQPPGIIHNAKYGDPWHYIFCYRHVHAASNLALEKNAIDYLRLLSTNQKENGWLRSCSIDFKSDAHPTSFDASYIDALYHYYKWTGDLESVKQLWSTLVKAAHYIEMSLNPDDDYLYRDTIHQWKSDADSRGPSSCFQTALVRKAYADLAEFADLLGHNWHAIYYKNRALKIEQAVQKELWSNEMAMLGSKGPLGMLRLHPECLEVEIPIWTELIDPWQSFVIADWFLNNACFTDNQDGLWAKESDWWPLMWSQALIADGDAAMIAWALLKTGHFDEGCKILETLAEAGFRSTSPGMSYHVDNRGSYYHNNLGGKDPATAIGALARVLVEGVFGIEPHLDKKYFIIYPRFASHWDNAEFSREKIEVFWQREGENQAIKIKMDDDVRALLKMPVKTKVEKVLVNGIDTDFTIEPAIKHSLVILDLPNGGANVKIYSKPQDWCIQKPKSLQLGETAHVSFRGIDQIEIDDRYHFFENLSSNKKDSIIKLKKAACGRATIFFNCRKDNIEWIEPVVFDTLPAKASDMYAKTVAEPLPVGTKLQPLDLTHLYNEDIQHCFEHYFYWDHGKHWPYESAEPKKEIKYWFQPTFRLSKNFESKEIQVNNIPFKLAPMGPGEAEKSPDLLMTANTPPYTLPTSFELEIDKKLHKIYILSLNMMLSQKSYVPAVDIIVHYEDDSTALTQLIAPVNFDSYEQDFGINTVAFPLNNIEYLDGSAVNKNAHTHHFTMTDILCNPEKKVKKVRFKSIATETFFALGAATLAVVEE